MTQFQQMPTSADARTSISGEDAYYYKTIVYEFGGSKLAFRVSQNLFSSYQIDVGTQFLLKTIGPGSRASKTLDLGCGYGPIGLALKACNKKSVVHLINRDALAVEYSRQNVRLNGLEDCETYGSLDYDQVHDNDLDLVVSNIPGKAGLPVIVHMVRDAASRLNSSGMAAIVVVGPLAAPVEQALRTLDGIQILKKEARSGHVVLHYRFGKTQGTAGDGQDSLSHDRHFRERSDFEYRGLRYSLEGAYGLHEFDSLSFVTMALLNEMDRILVRNPSQILILNPGVGHVPVFAWKRFGPKRVALVDPDLLSLRYSRKNLELNGCPAASIITSHQIGVSPDGLSGIQLLLALLREDESTQVAINNLLESRGVMANGGLALLAGTSTAITRLVSKSSLLSKMTIKKRTRSRGYSSLLLEVR